MQEKAIKSAIRGAFDIEKGRVKYSTIRERIITSARIDGIHLCQLIAAMIIASIGLNIDSTEAIVGAMLICPLMGSVLAIAWGLAVLDLRVVKSAVAGLVLECGICLITSMLYFYFSPIASETSELITNSSPTIWDLAIALVGGFAGALGLSRRKEPGTLVAGVAVATALMPPLCAVGFGIAQGNALLALSALYEFLMNVVYIAFGATAVFVWLHAPLVSDFEGEELRTPVEFERAERESRMLRNRLIIGLILFGIPSLYFSLQVVQDSRMQNEATAVVIGSYSAELVTQELEVVCPSFVSYRIGLEDFYRDDTDVVVQRLVATVVTSEELDADHRRELTALIRIHVPDVEEVGFEVSGT